MTFAESASSVSIVRRYATRLVIVVCLFGLFTIGFSLWSKMRSEKLLRVEGQYHLASALHSAAAREEIQRILIHLNRRLPSNYVATHTLQDEKEQPFNVGLSMELVWNDIMEVLKLQGRYDDPKFVNLTDRLRQRITIAKKSVANLNADKSANLQALEDLQANNKILAQLGRLHEISSDEIRIEIERAGNRDAFIYVMIFMAVFVFIYLFLRRWLEAISDVLDRQQKAEEQFYQSQKMAAVGQLTGGIAHDFNNLLGIIIGNVELLEDRVGDDKEGKHELSAVKLAVDRASSLTDRLLAFSRKQVLVPVTTDVADLIGGVSDMLQRSLGETVDIKLKNMPDLWLVTIDPYQFENCLVNLAINARDAMPEVGTLVIETANVTLDDTYAMQHQELTAGEYVTVSVSDTGTGIASEVLEQVFDPFFTTKEVGKGSGLGLSMVYGFAKQSRGHVTIYSEVGHGTTVRMYLPRSLQSINKQQPADDGLPEIPSGVERILVVEDDEQLREIPTSMLREQGYEVVEAGNGKEAIKYLKDKNPFDLLFTDVVLPGGMNGAQIGKQAKQLQPNIRVIYTTGYAENLVINGGKLDPGVTLIKKPYSRRDLLEKVRWVLDSDNV